MTGESNQHYRGRQSAARRKLTRYVVRDGAVARCVVASEILALVGTRWTLDGCLSGTGTAHALAVSAVALAVWLAIIPIRCDDRLTY